MNAAPLSATFFAVVLMACTAPALAKDKPKPAAPAAPACERAAFPGDPVCYGDEKDVRSLPTPSSSSGGHEAQSGYQVSDDVTVAGRSDMTLSKKMPVYLNNPNPNPHSQDVSGGAAVNYKF